jgi:hypothetical protein
MITHTLGCILAAIDGWLQRHCQEAYLTYNQPRKSRYPRPRTLAEKLVVMHYNWKVHFFQLTNFANDDALDTDMPIPSRQHRKPRQGKPPG